MCVSNTQALSSSLMRFRDKLRWPMLYSIRYFQYPSVKFFFRRGGLLLTKVIVLLRFCSQGLHVVPHYEHFEWLLTHHKHAVKDVLNGQHLPKFLEKVIFHEFKIQEDSYHSRVYARFSLLKLGSLRRDHRL